MLKIIDYNGAEHFENPCVLMLGYFDAMHVGHRALLHAARKLAAEENLKLGVMTFYDGKSGAQVYVFKERLSLYERLGADFVLAAHFDEAFRNTQKEDFLRRLFEKCNARALVCGEDFSFGKGAKGSVNDLKREAAVRGASVIVLPLVGIFKRRAAASLAKEYLAEGDIEKLNRLLVDRYFIEGLVSSEGRHVGTKIGFPTANIHLPPDKYPLKQGVYAVSVPLEGREYRGIANWGSRPTFDDGRVVFEVFADGYQGDLYGKEITVYFDRRIRDVKKFENAAALQAQLKQDLESIR